MRECEDNYRAQAEALVARWLKARTNRETLVDAITDLVRAAAEQAASEENEVCALADEIRHRRDPERHE